MAKIPRDRCRAEGGERLVLGGADQAGARDRLGQRPRRLTARLGRLRPACGARGVRPRAHRGKSSLATAYWPSRRSGTALAGSTMALTPGQG